MKPTCESNSGHTSAPIAMDAFAIRAEVTSLYRVFKLKVEVDEVNVVSTDKSCSQDYFFLSRALDDTQGGARSDGAGTTHSTGQLWIEGVAIPRRPGYVRQFVALKPGTEYDISFQLSPPTRRSKGR